MPNDDPSVNEALVVLSRQFDLAETRDERPDIGTYSLEDLRRMLSEKIAHLLDRNPSLLMSILYRVDVAERDVKRVLTQTAPDRIPLELADLLIERQLTKIRIRRAYTSKDRE